MKLDSRVAEEVSRIASRPRQDQYFRALIFGRRWALFTFKELRSNTRREATHTIDSERAKPE